MQYTPLKKRVALMRRNVENEFSSSGLEAAIGLSQNLDILIHYLYVFNRGNFCRDVRGLTGRRTVRNSAQQPASSTA